MNLSLKKAFRKLTRFVGKLFRKADHLLEFRLKIIEVVNKIKAAVESDTADWITDLLPGNTDDKILDFIRKHIPDVLKWLGLSKRVFISEALKDAIEELKKVPKSERAAYWKSMSADLYVKASGLPYETADEAIQATYRDNQPTV